MTTALIFATLTDLFTGKPVHILKRGQVSFVKHGTTGGTEVGMIGGQTLQVTESITDTLQKLEFHV